MYNIMYSKQDYVKEVSSVFDLSWLSNPRTPIEIAEFEFKTLPELRLNHYLVKNDDTNEYRLGDVDLAEMRSFIDICEDELRRMALS